MTLAPAVLHPAVRLPIVVFLRGRLADRNAVASRYEVAHEEAAIGGDLFAIHETAYGIRMLIADVRGKGLKAVRTVNALLGSFHEASHHRPDLRASSSSWRTGCSRVSDS